MSRTLPPAPRGGGAGGERGPGRVPPESVQWSAGDEDLELEAERIAGHFPLGYLNMDAARLAAARGLGALHYAPKGPMSYTDRIRAGDVDPYVDDAVDELDGAERTVAIINDELATLDADDPRRHTLTDQRAAWQERAARARHDG